jgi:hypothetical protein
MKTRLNGSNQQLSSLVISTSPVKLFGVFGANNAAATRYIQVHPSPTLPADGAVPLLSIAVAAGGSYFATFSQGMDLDALTLCTSTTQATKTLDSASCLFNAMLAL